MKVKKIVIVGGGSAGWMTAAILIKSFPEKNITLVESPKIPSIGVGESTYDGINYYLEYLEIDRDSFFSETDASIKLGVEFLDFYEKNSGSFVYPFGIPYEEETFWGMQDWMIKKVCYPETPTHEFAESYFPAAHMIKHNTFYENIDNVLPNFDPRIHTALHFDAQKFAIWLKEKYCLPKGVNNIIKEIKEIKVDKKNKKIDFLITEDQTKIYADLFIDCTGFKSLLLGQALEEKFISYNDILPNNRSWATQIPYKNKKMELETTTRCTAIGNGWVWNTPLYSRIGSGYVYSDKFISSEDALKEFKDHLMSEKTVIPRTEKDLQSLEFKDIKIRVGIHEKIWVNNVVAIGLSAAFIEPLEGNGLFSVHEFLFQLVRALQKEKVSSWDIHVFNEKNRDLYEGFVEFIKLHYALSIRDDTEYWKNNISSEYSFKRLDAKNIKNAHMLNLFEQKVNTYIPSSGGGFLTGVACISTGMNYSVLDRVSCRLGEIQYNLKYKDFMKVWFDKNDKKVSFWDSVAKSSPTMYEYLKEKYYKNEK